MISRKWYRWTYLQGRKRVTDIQNGHVNIGREGKGGTNWKSSVDKHTLCCCLVTKSCLTLCDPMNYSPPSSSVHGISQARILRWVAISFSRESSQSRDWNRVSCLAGGFLTTEPPGSEHWGTCVFLNYSFLRVYGAIFNYVLNGVVLISAGENMMREN